MKNRKSLIIVGPALSRSGYGEQTRFAIDSIRKNGKYDLYLHNTGWGKSNWIPHTDPKRGQIDKLISKTVKLERGFRADVSLQVGIPTDFKMYSDVNIGYTAGSETNSVDKEWIVSCNMMNGIITPSSHSRASLKNTQSGSLKLETRAHVVNFPHTLSSAQTQKNCDIRSFLSSTAKRYNFLTVAQVSPRKNIFNLIKWFLREFAQDPDVVLYLKLHRKDCSIIDRFETEKSIKDYIDQTAPNKKCGVYLIHGDLSRAQMKSLYQSGHMTHYLNASHGEGFGLPLFDAAASDLVVVSHMWSGETDYLDKNSIVLVDHQVKKVAESTAWPGILNKDSSWAYVRPESFRACLRSSVDDFEGFRKKSKILGRKIRKKFTTEKQSFMLNQAIESIIKNGEKIHVKKNNY